jgi:hypothetical protein
MVETCPLEIDLEFSMGAVEYSKMLYRGWDLAFSKGPQTRMLILALRSQYIYS